MRSFPCIITLFAAPNPPHIKIPVSKSLLSMSNMDFPDGWNNPNGLLEAAIGGPITLRGIQKVGENVFAATLIVAMLQAVVAFVQYRTNPTGQLIAPPGLTRGVALPPLDREKKTPSPAESTTNCANEQSLESLDKVVSVALEKATTISTATSQYSRIIQRINRWLVLLIPWTTRRIAFVLQRNTHIFHLGFIMMLAGLFDLPNRWFLLVNSYDDEDVDSIEIPSELSTQAPLERLVVIGDSLAVGMGTVDIFDAAKNNSVPYTRIENLVNEAGGHGPVFPRVLAESLASHSHTSVFWRSAGVDGGDVQLIEEHCVAVIEEEVSEGHSPDIVVIICGINDLKYFVSNPFRSAGPRAFRSRLKKLIKKIKRLCPDAKVILPMVPTQMFRQNSPLNIFPLNLFLDSIVGFWDSQKKLVADQFSSRDVLYLRLSPGEVYDWYHLTEDTDDDKDASLIAADGVHPNTKCYSLWANSLGNKLVTVVNKRP